jgi:hypothetical protein
MKVSLRRHSRSLGLALVGAALAGLIISPVGAHVGNTIDHLWNGPGHIKDKAKNLFFTKDQSNSRFQPQWAQVSSDGDVIRHSGGISASHDSDGHYYVRFPTRQNSRGISVTPVYSGSQASGQVLHSAVQCGTNPGASTCTDPHANNQRKIHVHLRVSSGPIDVGFYIVSLP